MKRLCIILVACFLAAGCLFTEYNRQSRRERSHELLMDADWEKTKAVFENLSKCAVTIKGTGFATGRGSGVLISEDGYILTCAHVVEVMCDLPAPLSPTVKETIPVIDETSRGKECEILMSATSEGGLLITFSNGHSANASLVAFNRKYDLALLKTSFDKYQFSAEPEPGLRIMPGDVLVAVVAEGENEPVERLITAGKVIVPYSALSMPQRKSKYASGILLRTYGYAGMSGAPLFTRDGRFAGLVKNAALGIYGDRTSFIVATSAEDILRLLPDMKKGISERNYFTPQEFLAERERQNSLQVDLANEVNPGFEKDENFITAIAVGVDQYGKAIEALKKAGNADRFGEIIALVCVLDIYAARYMYPPENRAELVAFFDRE